jgi:sugar lactone lactonase YvrE
MDGGYSDTLWSLDSASVFVEGLDHPEGVAVHPDGSIWAGGEAGQIYRVSSDGATVDEVANTGGFVLGIAFSPDASWLVACDTKLHCLWRVSPETGEVTEFADGVGTYSFKIPNYACFASDGTLYVSDSGTPRENDGLLTRFSADHNGVGEIWHSGPFNFANGICLAPDENSLYVVASFLPGVERVEINPDGSAGKREVVVELPRTVPDGLAFDAKGNLYISCYSPNRIYRLQPDGQLDLLLDDWDMHTLSNPTNIAFGGADFDQLFTANLGRWHLTRIDCGVKGHPLPCHHRDG